MYHPYKDGYSVLPALNKLEDPPFHVDRQLEWYLEEKRKAQETQQVFGEHNISGEIYDAFAEFIQKHGPDHVQPPYTLESVAMQVQEDIAIHRIKDGKDWLAAYHICLPSGWWPERSLGKPLEELHAPIPGMNLKNSYKLAETMVHHGPFYRFIWTPIYEYRINFHPSKPKKPFNPIVPTLYVKVERQITWGVPELGAAFFILREFIVEPSIPDLWRACRDMNEAQRAYKGITQEFIDTMEKMLW